MPQRRAHIAPSAAQSELAASLAALRADIAGSEDFDPAALAEAGSVAEPEPEIDLREVPFATLDPVGSKDLDQAFHLERSDSGFVVRYAIADLPGFVIPEGAVDTAARERGQTLYAADGAIPLHPREFSEDRASLLPGVDRSALVWTFDLDAQGSVASFRLERARVRSRAQLDYATVQAELDAGTPGPASLLPEIGELRLAQEAQRGGASLNLPDEEVVRDDHGHYAIARRRPLPVEEWNAQLSLMTGMAAASLMIEAGVGVLRTMPAPDEAAFDAFRRQTQVLGRPWTAGLYGEYLRSLDREDPLTLPILQAATALFRGAGYVVFDSGAPDAVEQAALAAPYAHATAPLRRLVDRWALAVCLAVSNGQPVPEWVTASLPELPGLMKSSGQRAGALNRGTVDRVEAALMAPHVGTRVAATVVSRRGERATVQLAEPVVSATLVLDGAVELGSEITLDVVRADIAAGEVEFAHTTAVDPAD